MIQFSKDRFLVLLLILVLISSALDLATDLSQGIGIDHIAKEALVVALSVAAIGWLLYGLKKQRREIGELKSELEKAKGFAASANDQVLTARRELGKVIAQQFSEWGLTRSEQEVAWLLLKGLSLKEISAVRSTAEKTVRQQASSIYRKAEVVGRHGFSAWFIEDLL